MEKTETTTPVGVAAEECQHAWTNKKVHDGMFTWCYKNGGTLNRGTANILLSRTCDACGTEETKPVGAPYQTCHFCWSPMKFHRKLPGQGSDGESIYHCTNADCAYGYWDT